MDIETKKIGGKITETKQEERNGVPVGIIEGYLATWDVDRGEDRFVKGAFLESLREHKKKNRQIRFNAQHFHLIGGFPIDTAKEDTKGLFVVGEVNLDTQGGRENFSLAKQKVLVDFSIGFSAVDWEIKDGIRVINKAIVWEGSIVDEPMNPEAQITEVKKLIALDDFKSLTDRELEAALCAGVKFSGKKAKIVISALKAAGLRDGDSDGHRDGEDWSGVLNELKKTQHMLEEK